MGPTGPVDDDRGAPMPRPSVTCGMRPIETGGAGLPGHKTGDMRPDETGGVSPRRVLQLDSQRGGRPELAVVAYLFRMSCHCTPYLTLRQRFFPRRGLSLREVPGSPTPLGRTRPTPHPWGRVRRTRPIAHPWIWRGGCALHQCLALDCWRPFPWWAV